MYPEQFAFLWEQAGKPKQTKPKRSGSSAVSSSNFVHTQSATWEFDYGFDCSDEN